MSTDTTAGSEPELDFEDALRRLEDVVDTLERGEPGLSEALAKYEEGVRLLARCQGLLDRAERSVALLSGVDEAGEPVTAPFDASATATVDPPSVPTPTAKKSRKRASASPPPDDESIPF